jgi:hypothetical protein
VFLWRVSFKWKSTLCVHTDYGRAVFPALEIVAEVPFERGEEPDRPDAVQFSIVPQARIGLNKRGNIELNTRC